MSISRHGFNFEPGPDAVSTIFDGSTCSPDCPDNGTNYLFMQDTGQFHAISLTNEAGMAFSLISIDLSESFEGKNVEAAQVDITGLTTNGSTVAASFFLDGIQDGPGGANDFETFLLPSFFVNLVSVELNGSGGVTDGTLPDDPGYFRQDFSLDNVELSIVPLPAIPLPAALPLFGTGLGILGFLGWRRRRKAV